jgi:phage shock protein E
MRQRLVPWLLLSAVVLYGQTNEQSHPYRTTEAIMAAIQSRQQDFFLVDVRTPDEFRQKRIPGSINIPVEIISSRLPTRNFNATIVLVDRFGNRAHRAKYALESMGFRRVFVFGKIRDWTGPILP